ncbi:MAG TPA: peptide ABC transporter substrate-binding protein [Phycisphaerae bacterium]
MRRVLLIPSVVLLILFITCYVFSARPFFAPPSARPIVIATLDDIKTLDTGKMSWANDIRVAMALWEGLTVYDIDHNLKPVPGAAEKWEISEDRKTYTFHLRPSGRWSNGDPVTANDFIFAWKRALDPVTGADYIGLLKDIKGAEDYTAAMEKRKPDDPPPPDPAGIRKIDNLTLQVQLSDPCTYFLDLVAMPVFFPMHQKSMASFLMKDPTQGYDEAFTQPPNLVTNGAFKLTEWRIKQSLTLEPNTYYWDAGNVHCAQLVVRPISDMRMAFMLYESGDVDLMTFLPREFADTMVVQHDREGKWPELHHTTVFGTYYYIFNVTRKPFDDKRVRKALAMAIDRRKIVEILNTGEEALGLIVPPGTISGYKSPAELPYDVEGARKLLADAGYPGGKGLKSIELLYNMESFHPRIAQAMGQMWQTELGVSVTYRGLERGSFGKARRDDHDFDLARGGWYGDYPDPTTWLDLFRKDDGNNDGKFASKDYDDLMMQSDKEADPARRFLLLKKAEEMIVSDEVPFLPLYQYADGFIYDEKKLKGAELNNRVLTQLKWIRREK